VEQSRRETGGLSTGKIGGHKTPILSGAHSDWLRIRSGPFTLRKLAGELAARGIQTNGWAAWTLVHDEGLGFKKNDPASRADRPDIARKRTRWKAYQSGFDASRPPAI
jgi:transposase